MHVNGTAQPGTDEYLHEREWARAGRLLHRSRYAIALTGAGLSSDSGIPTFHGTDGLWTRQGGPPMDSYQRFLRDPAAWWRRRRADDFDPAGQLARAIARAQPNPGHVALAGLQRAGYLRTIITQNIDNLHSVAGSDRLLEIHGNHTLVRCIVCEARSRSDQIRRDELPPRCDRCGGIIKPDTVLFGEPIPPSTLERCQDAALRADCILVVGTSALVAPAADLPVLVWRTGGVLIEINVAETELTPFCDVVLREPAAQVLPKLFAAVDELELDEPEARSTGVRHGT